MSRIFEALLRSKQQNSNKDSSDTHAEVFPWQKLLPTWGAQSSAFEPAARISEKIKGSEHIVAHSPEPNVGTEKFRVLRHRLHQIRQARRLTSVLVTSSIPKEGKTVVAVNLAITLALSSQRVLLVDADLREPGVHRALGLPQLPGLAEILEGREELEGVVHPVESTKVHYLPAGRTTSNPVELLESVRMRDLVSRLVPAFDWIVVDSPPVIPVADSHGLATLVDGVVFVVRSGSTPREDVQQGIEMLRGAFITGVVFNASDERRHYGYYYYPSARAVAQTAKSAAAHPSAGGKEANHG